MLLDQGVTASHELDHSGRFEDRAELGDAAEHDPPIADLRSRDAFAPDPVLKTKNRCVVPHQARDRTERGRAVRHFRCQDDQRVRSDLLDLRCGVNPHDL